MDKLFKSTVFNGDLSLSVIECTDMVNKAIKLHNLTPTTAAALGRALIVGTFMSADLKNAKDKLSFTIVGDGAGGKITVCGNGKLEMRGSILNPQCDLPLKANGKLDVGGCVGHNGRITVVKDMGLKEPYSGTSELVSGEIAEDFVSYFFYSEQRYTAIAIGVKIGKNRKCVGAGGVFLTAFPNAKEENLIKAENLINSLTQVSTMIENGGAEGVIKDLFGDTVYDSYYPKYKCLCSKHNTEKIVCSLGKKEFEDIIKEFGKVEVVCEFCNKKYEFYSEDEERIFGKQK